MVIELIVNILLLGFCVFCFGYVGSTMPVSAVNELGAEQWPQGILILLILAILWNIIKFFRAHKPAEISAAFQAFPGDVAGFFKSKLFIGMVLVVIMAIAYEPIGFMLTCFLFLMAYGLLLGQRNIALLVGTSLLITVILYIGFAVFLGVLLPRGNVSFLRDFALFVESLVPSF